MPILKKISHSLCSASLIALFFTLTCSIAFAANDFVIPTGQVVVPPDALLSATAGGLDQTDATQTSELASGIPFDRALVIKIGKDSAETNATQFNIHIQTPVVKGDTMIGSLWLRGTAADGKSPASISFLFEKTDSPWTNSISETEVSLPGGTKWRHIVVPFAAADNYQPGEAMASIRLAFGPQTVELAGLAVEDLGTAISLNDLVEEIAYSAPPLDVRLAVNASDRRQTFVGFGGDFCQARYGKTDMIDPVGATALANLDVKQARVGIPLDYWAPNQGDYHDDAQSHAAFLIMQLLYRKGIQIIGSVWEGPQWLLPGGAGKGQRVLDPSQYGACIDAIAQFLVTARDKYGVTVDYFSFNEANYGVNFLFTADTIDAFIKQAGPRFAQLGLKTKFLVGDTTSIAPFASYVQTLIHDPVVQPYLGSLSFHCWDALSATDSQYASIAEIGRQTGKPIYCTEAGWDAGLWQKANAFPSWDNGLHTAQAYARTLRLSGACTMDYWTYEDNYPLTSSDGKSLNPAFKIIQQLQKAVPSGSTIIGGVSDSSEIEWVASSGPRRSERSVLIVAPNAAANVSISGLIPNAAMMETVSDKSSQNSPAGGRLKVNSHGSCIVHVGARSAVTLSSE
jgi:O-glycosyl hydrolase